MSLPAGKLFLAAYLFVMIVFLASHMDAVAYTMAATSTRNLREGEIRIAACACSGAW